MRLVPPLHPSLPVMPAHRFSRRTHLAVLACYLWVLAAASVSPWLEDAPLGPLCRGGGGSFAAAMAAAAADGPSADTLDCAACLPLQLVASAATTLPAGAIGPDHERPLPPVPFIDPLRVALPPARGPPFV